MNNEIIKAIETLRKSDYFGAGYATEIAKESMKWLTLGVVLKEKLNA